MRETCAQEGARTCVEHVERAPYIHYPRRRRRRLPRAKLHDPPAAGRAEGGERGLTAVSCGEPCEMQQAQPLRLRKWSQVKAALYPRGALPELQQATLAECSDESPACLRHAPNGIRTWSGKNG